MKSERRHELQHNELADWLAKSAEAIKPYQNMIFAAVVVVLVGVVGYTVWSRMSAAQTTQAWDELSTAIESGNVAKLAKVIEDYPQHQRRPHGRGRVGRLLPRRRVRSAVRQQGHGAA